MKTALHTNKIIAHAPMQGGFFNRCCLQIAIYKANSSNVEEEKKKLRAYSTVT